MVMFTTDPSWIAVLSDQTLAEKIDESNKLYARKQKEWFRSGSSLHPGNIKYYFRRLRGNFGCPFVSLLASVYFGVKGLMAAMLGLCAMPLFLKFYGINIERYQSYLVAVMVPWSLKPIVGVVSDCVPIANQNKRPYVLGATVVGCVCILTLGLQVSGDAASNRLNNGTHAQRAALYLGGASTQAAVTDLLTEGKYAELMSYKPAASSDLTTFVSVMYFMSMLAAAAIAGPLVATGKLASVVWASLVPSAQAVVPFLCGVFPERKSNACSVAVPVGYIGLSVIMATFAVGLAAVNVHYSDPEPKVAYSVFTGIILCILSFKVFSTVMARCNLYLFLSSATYLSLSGAMDAFYTADRHCLKDGPHFSLTFYITVSSLIGSIVGLIATSGCQALMRNWHFRKLFWVGTVLKCSAALVDLTIVLRWNKSIGVNDHWAYMLGHNIAETIVMQLDWIPAVVLTSKLCTNGHEATVYALLAGFQNYGNAISSSIGTAVTTAAGVHANGDDSCDFHNLPQLILFSHVALPLLVLPLTFVLIPNARMTDSIKHS